MPNPTTTHPAAPGTREHLLPGAQVVAADPLRCPYGRHFSKITGKYSVDIGYDDLTSIMDMVFTVWDSLRLDATDDKIGDAFKGLVEHVESFRQWTGWGGVPGEYVGNDL